MKMKLPAWMYGYRERVGYTLLHVIYKAHLSLCTSFTDIMIEFVYGGGHYPTAVAVPCRPQP